jgi:hypothetical protein
VESVLFYIGIASVGAAISAIATFLSFVTHKRRLHPSHELRVHNLDDRESVKLKDTFVEAYLQRYQQVIETNQKLIDTINREQADIEEHLPAISGSTTPVTIRPKISASNAM